MTAKLSSLAEVQSHPTITTWLVAVDVRSAYNVGAMFRTADGTGSTGIILAGYSPTPENPKVNKTALGAEFHVPWFVVSDPTELFSKTSFAHIGLETTQKAQNIFTWTPTKRKLFLYVGNEVTGLPLSVMTGLKEFVRIPMVGLKQSLNVAEAASIAMYELFRKNQE